jgi:hypothetical protein
MNQTKTRLLFFLTLVALLAIFAGCKSESPTAPPPVGSGGTGGAGNPPGGGVTPPVGAGIVLTVSNPSPLIDSVSTITATVTLNGQAVVNGTAVEFVTNLGTFTDTNDVRTIRTTTNGVASAVLTSSTAGTATVNATVNNVTKTVQITFNEQQVVPPPPSTAPTISTITPATGPPAGGTIITISGTNFRSPARVVIDAGPAGSHEAFVQSVTPTQIIAITPKIDLISTQTQAAAVTVIVDAGNPTEARVTKAAGFTYITTNLTPVIRAISPGSGPIEGGTRVTIIGDAFDAGGGVQVFFGAAQAQVVSVNFNQIIVMSPTARDTAPNGSGAVTGPVNIKILNVASGKSVIAEGGFRYAPKMQITLLGPNVGPSSGGTRFQIDGTGFDDPLSVTLAGVAAQIIKVTGTQIIGISSPAPITNCADLAGPIIVTNGNNGDSATGTTWTYKVVKPIIQNVTPSSTPLLPGQTFTITVSGLTGTPSVKVGPTPGNLASVTNVITNPVTGISTITAIVPNGLPFATAACAGTPSVIAPQETAFDVLVTSTDTTCSDTANKALFVTPGTPVLALSPPAGFTPFSATAATPAPTAFVPATPQVVTVVNGGGGTLFVTGFTTSGTGCGNFTISTPPVLGPPGTPLAKCEPFPITVNYTPPIVSPAGTNDQCLLKVTTSGGNQTFILAGSVK